MASPALVAITGALKQVPIGFFTANDYVNTFTPPLLTAVVDDILARSAAKTPTMRAVDIHTFRTQTQLTTAQFESAINALQLIINAVSHANTGAAVSAADITSALTAATDISPSHITIIAERLTVRDNKQSAASAYASQLPALESFHWRVGMSVESSDGAALYSPFVTAIFRAVDVNGTVQRYTVEMNMSQFATFAKAFRQMHSTMETL